MSLLLKDVKELQDLNGKILEFDPTKRYLVVFYENIPVSLCKMVRTILADNQISASILSGVRSPMKIFEMEECDAD